MKQREDTDRHDGGLEAQRTVRKPYVKPAARYEQVFETRALTCGKVGTTQSQCKLEPKTS
ncbi:MAG: hypothetical protein WAO35_12560 [Terriglobia bacterium]